MRDSASRLDIDSTNMAILHYIYDPLCGWCYAAESLIEAAASIKNLQIVLHGGGLFSEAMHLPAAKRDHIRLADARIGQMSGQMFGDAYLNGLLADPATVYDSRPPIAAMLAVQSLRSGSGLAMLKALQHAHYRDGRRIVEPAVLTELAVSIGMEHKAFMRAYGNFAGASTDRHIGESRRLMQHVGAHGFPAFCIENEKGYAVARHDACYGEASLFRSMLESRIQH